MRKKQDVLKLIEKIARVKQEQNAKKWPPPCMGFLHQPKRPVKGR